MMNSETHPTLRFLEQNPNTPIFVYPFTVLAYEHVPKARKKIQFRVDVHLPNEQIDCVGVKAFVFDDKHRRLNEDPTIIYSGEKPQYDGNISYIFKDLVLEKPKNSRGLTPCFLRFFVRLKQPLLIQGINIPILEISSVDVPMPICTHKTSQAVECDLWKIFPTNNSIKIHELALLMSQYQKWTTRPIEEIEVKGHRIPRVRIPTYEEWKTILDRYETTSIQNVEKTPSSSTISQQRKFECNEEAVAVLLKNWTSFVDLLLSDEDFRQLWNEGHIYIVKSEGARQVLEETPLDQCPIGSFVLKIGITWLTTGKAGPIVIVEKINRSGRIEIRERYLAYETLNRFGLGYLILSDTSGNESCQFWINKNRECIPKNHSKSPFKVKTDVQKVLSRYDSFQNKSESKDKRAHPDSPDFDDETIPQCKNDCDYSELSKWKYCPLCGQPLTRCVEKKRLFSTTNTTSDSSIWSPSGMELSSLTLNDDSLSTTNRSSIHVTPFFQFNRSSTSHNPFGESPPLNVSSNVNVLPTNFLTNGINTNNPSNTIDTVNNTNISSVDVNVDNNISPPNLWSNINLGQSTIQNVFTDDSETKPPSASDYILSDEEVSHLP